jgi:hypothetical protein
VTWKGSKETPIAEIEVTVDYPKEKMSRFTTSGAVKY